MGLAFAAPWILLSLAVLPALWWLLRVIPPSPRRRVFPPLQILRRAALREETAARTPLWLLFLRLLAAAVLILSAAGPVLHRTPTLAGTGPLILVVDNGWASSRDWTARRAAMNAWIERAERQARTVLLVTTADDTVAGPIDPPSAARRAEAVMPHPWPTDRTAAIERLRAALPSGTPPGAVVWLSDGLADATKTARFMDQLSLFGAVRVLGDGQETVLLHPPVVETEGLGIVAERSRPGPALKLSLRIADTDGKPLDRVALEFRDGSTRAETRIAPPAEVRNRIARIAIEGAATAGAVALLDEGARRRPVGLISGPPGSETTPLLSAFHYLSRALGPFAEIRRGTAGDLLNRDTAVLAMADASVLGPGEAETVDAWIARGGMLIRFAGPHLARSTAKDDLLPVRLRGGERSLGGALSWAKPSPLAPFEQGSPFHGLAIPDDIRIETQVLARPGPELDRKTWARLSDGTPLVTAESRGRGRMVLFHTEATPEWSNLPLSGLFVAMLRRLTDIAHGIKREARSPLPPVAVLNGFGHLGPAAATVLPLPPDRIDAELVGPTHPPGFYGVEGGLRALNLAPAVGSLRPLPGSIPVEPYGAATQRNLAPWLFVLALLLLVVDLAASLGMRGMLGMGGATAVAVLAVFTARAEPIDTLQGDVFAEAASLETRLGYVLSGDPRVDSVSRAGLRGLGFVVNRRTAAELAEPVGIDIDHDPVVFFPILYWPLTDAPAPSVEAAAKVRDYLAGGGVVLFDSRDPQGTISASTLRTLADALDVPPLEPAPESHVLGRSFYLLRDFPGRWAGGTLWVERPGGRLNDGVSSVIVGANDWAGAWAADDLQQPLFPVIPGGERQREMAYRFGVNLVMYALTGNYKGDQVHLPAILKRLGL